MARSRRLGNYELLRPLARGGMADIYLARQIGLDRQVAIKVLSELRSHDPEACALFLDEARVVGLLRHVNLAGIYEVAVEDGVHYLAMEYVHGADLRDVMTRAQAPLAVDCALTIVARAAAGLDYAHRRVLDDQPLRLVHRDVSLSNIMCTHEGEVKLIDFGIAVSTASQHKTRPGIVRGKAAYMSPEQCRGERVDARSDVFALGVVLYELTTGKRCFVGESDFERMLAVVRGEYVRPSLLRPDLPSTIEHVIETALAIDPAQRYQSAAALGGALQAAASIEGLSIGTDAITRMMGELFDAWEDTVVETIDSQDRCCA